LSPELQRAAEFSLQNASQLVVLSMRAFAAEARPATLLRLAQRLGYRGWSELKVLLTIWVCAMIHMYQSGK
jgi:DNA-binding MurR/RpiR family transcriptional regulator